MRDLREDHWKILQLVGHAHSTGHRVEASFCLEKGLIHLYIADDAKLLHESVLAHLVREVINAAAGDLQRQIRGVLSGACWSIGDVVRVQCALATKHAALDDAGRLLVERFDEMAHVFAEIDSVWMN